MYSKPVTTIAQQIRQLKERGLLISDDEAAAHYLSNISYYRRVGYWWPMQADKITHIFKPNSKFDDVIALYNFDRELRILLFDVIERIEISLRTKMSYHLSHEHGFWWFQKTELFLDTRQLIVTLASLEEELQRSKDIFIKDHKKKHSDDLRFPPSIKTLEIATFGNLSRMYGNLKPGVAAKDAIASELKTVNHTYLHSWLQSIAQIRNTCAHHSRLWNKSLAIKPSLLPKPPAPWIENVPPANEHNKLYIHVCCMKYLLDAVSPGHHLKEKLAALFEKYPSVDLAALGFDQKWRQEPLWT
ncbi:Abi family protein [Puia sp.]|jgi:abortive infection bacteriophage resistance protein|uniref:Abi family protein n=1 Tax=Puia sp. TaxID=2045100 RepID=UPI002F42F165